MHWQCTDVVILLLLEVVVLLVLGYYYIVVLHQALHASGCASPAKRNTNLNINRLLRTSYRHLPRISVENWICVHTGWSLAT